MRHPFEAIPADRRKLIFGPALALTLVVMASLSLVGVPLNTDAAPQGILSFELAGSAPAARAILDSWDPLTRVHAGFSLGLDFLFLVLYSTTIGLACVWAASVWRNQRQSLAAVGLLLAWGQGLAALLDAVENTALLVTLLGSPAAPWPQIALGCAALKFGLILLGLAYVASAVVKTVL